MNDDHSSQPHPEPGQRASTVRITNWRPARRAALLGFCRAQYTSGVIICEISIIQAPRGPWAAPPSKPRVSSDGTVKRDERGKVSHITLIDFSTPELKHRWSAEIIAAMRSDYPNFDSDDHSEVDHSQGDYSE